MFDYDIKVEDGMNCIHSFLDGWFIEKCLWASRNLLKETATSIKKFYQRKYGWIIWTGWCIR